MQLFKQAKKVEAFKRCFNTPDGKIVLSDLAKECGILNNSYNGDTDDLLFNEGKRNVLLYILSIVNVDLPKLLEIIEKERQLQGEKPNEY